MVSWHHLTENDFLNDFVFFLCCRLRVPDLINNNEGLRVLRRPGIEEKIRPTKLAEQIYVNHHALVPQKIWDWKRLISFFI
jgi:hypothetical protein